MSAEIRVGDCLDVLRTLDAGTVQTCVTSPPYFGLRDYGVAGQIGLESTPDGYVAKLVDVFREVRRVLRPDGTVWLNLGDSYSGGGKGGNPGSSPHLKQRTNEGSLSVRGVKRDGDKPKDLLGIPWRVAFALQADGWYLRSDIIWAKPNPMPESVADRPTKAHEYLFLLAKAERYFYDADAIAEEAAPESASRYSYLFGSGSKAATSRDESENGLDRRTVPIGERAFSGKRNKRTVWTVEATGNRERECLAILESDIATADKWYAIKCMMSGAQSDVWRIATQPYSGAHFATFPPALIEPCILAGSRKGDTVLDPFGGAGTTGLVADRLGRNALLIELNPAYAELARRRIVDDAPLFNAGEVA